MDLPERGRRLRRHCSGRTRSPSSGVRGRPGLFRPRPAERNSVKSPAPENLSHTSRKTGECSLKEEKTGVKVELTGSRGGFSRLYSNYDFFYVHVNWRTVLRPEVGNKSLGGMRLDEMNQRRAPRLLSTPNVSLKSNNYTSRASSNCSRV